MWVLIALGLQLGVCGEFVADVGSLIEDGPGLSVESVPPARHSFRNDMDH